MRHQCLNDQMLWRGKNIVGGQNSACIIKVYAATHCSSLGYFWRVAIADPVIFKQHEEKKRFGGDPEACFLRNFLENFVL